MKKTEVQKTTKGVTQGVTLIANVRTIANALRTGLDILRDEEEHKIEAIKIGLKRETKDQANNLIALRAKEIFDILKRDTSEVGVGMLGSMKSMLGNEWSLKAMFTDHLLQARLIEKLFQNDRFLIDAYVLTELGVQVAILFRDEEQKQAIPH